MLLHHHNCFGYNIKFLLYLYIFHIIYNVIFIYVFLFIPSLEMAAFPHRATPGQRDVFSEMYMLTGPGWS